MKQLPLPLYLQPASPLRLPDLFRPTIKRLFFFKKLSIRHWSGWHAPAVQALAVQIVAGLMTWAIVVWAGARNAMPITLGHAALLQGVLAALLTLWRGLAFWWIVIELVFPLALLATLAIHLPPLIFLLAFVFMVALYWSTFRTQVPFYPSAPDVWQAVLPLLPSDRPIRMIDIGSGLGGLVMHLAQCRPESSFVGIELAPLPWLVSRVRAAIKGSRARFIIGDYDALDLGQFDVVFAYLSPAVMPALWQKWQREMHPGALLLSYEFLVPGQAPQITVLPNPQGPRLYGWEC